jgi:hypothetical protein
MQTAALLLHKNSSGAAPKKSSETSMKQKILRIQPRLAFINGASSLNILFSATRSVCTASNTNITVLAVSGILKQNATNSVGSVLK